jgi:uncharacterized protein (TIGR03435 family)
MLVFAPIEKGWCVMLKSRLLGAVGIVAVVGGVLAAQTPASPAFEVASVKLVEPPAPAHAVRLNISPGRLGIDAATLRQIIGLAYGIQRVRVTGGPSWADADQYNIAAKTESLGTSQDQVRMMLQNLLTERFKLALHHEAKELRAYRLVSGKNSPTLQAAKAEEKSAVGQENGQLTFSNMPLAALINTLANVLDSPVQDETGLSGSYDFKLTTMTAGDGPTSIFTVVQEQLGLKLEPIKEPLDVIVIDHVEHPTED